MTATILKSRRVSGLCIIAVPALLYVSEIMIQPLAEDHMRAPKTTPIQNVPLMAAALSAGPAVSISASTHINYVSLAPIPDQIIEREYDPTPHPVSLYTTVPAKDRES